MSVLFVPVLLASGCNPSNRYASTITSNDESDEGLGKTHGDDAADASLSGEAGDASDARDAGPHIHKSPFPIDHRPEAEPCPDGRGPGHIREVGECAEDSECTDGVNGRCLSSTAFGPFGDSVCSYDECTTDEDCLSLQACRCRSSAESNVPNYCIDGNCRVDSDCGEDGYCSASLLGVDSAINSADVSGSGFAQFGYFCHTPEDLCNNPSDCDGAVKCLPEEGCGYLTCGYSNDGRWDCFRVGTR